MKASKSVSGERVGLDNGLETHGETAHQVETTVTGGEEDLVSGSGKAGRVLEVMEKAAWVHKEGSPLLIAIRLMLGDGTMRGTREEMAESLGVKVSEKTMSNWMDYLEEQGVIAIERNRSGHVEGIRLTEAYMSIAKMPEVIVRPAPETGTTAKLPLGEFTPILNAYELAQEHPDYWEFRCQLIQKSA